MPLQFLSDPRFYTDYAYCMSQFRREATPQTSPQPLIFHGYWGGRLTQHHELCLKSLLVTQSPPFQVWVWMSAEDIQRNRAFIAKVRDIATLHWKVYRYEEEARGTPFAGQPPLAREDDLLNIANTLRLLALWKYGGVYFDFDILFLKDLRPLCNVDFCYQWSKQPYGNNAVFHTLQGSKDCERLIARGLSITRFNPRYLLRFDEIDHVVESLHVWPVFLFDPVWLAHDTQTRLNSYCNRFPDFFTNTARVSLARFFPGAFTYHWHNAWHTPIRRHTIVGQLFDEIEARFKALYYGKG